MKTWKLRPEHYIALRDTVQRWFDRIGSALTVLAGLGLPACLLLARLGGANEAIHLLAVMAVVFGVAVLVQGAGLAAVTRANHAAARWMVDEQRKVAETAPKKGQRIPAGHEPCPCGSNNRYRSCCRPKHQGLRLASAR